MRGYCSIHNGIREEKLCLLMVAALAFFLKQNFRNALQEEWKVSLSHRSKLKISFEEPSACVEYPSNLKGWNIIPDSAECVVSH